VVFDILSGGELGTLTFDNFYKSVCVWYGKAASLYVDTKKVSKNN